MSPTRHLLFLAILLAYGPVFAETEAADDTAQDFDIPGGDADVGSSVFHLDDANTALNPLQKLVQNWPEDLVIAPVPAYSAQLGWSLTLGGAYFLNIGEENPDVAPSAIGGFVLTAENGSYAYGAGTNLHLLEDKLRVKGGAIYVDVRYRFYGIGNNAVPLDIDIVQNGPGYFLTGSWNVWKKLYVGLGYLRGSVDTGLRFELTPPRFFDPTLDLDMGAFTIPIEIDSRDHEQFPRDGWFIKAQTKLYRESAGSDFEGEVYKLSINHYLPMRESDALATRLMVKSASEVLRFFLLSTFGGTTDLRGYPSGRYRDQKMYALQTEYRWQFSDRWVFTGFVGVGEVAESFSDVGSNFLPAGGIGTRFVLSEKHKVGLSVDLAMGKDGTEFYFGVGEAF